jgi:hypothetical protein
MIDAKRRQMEEKLAALRKLEPYAAAAAWSDPFPHLVLRYGVESSEWVLEWCERAKAELSRPKPKPENATRRTA